MTSILTNVAAMRAVSALTATQRSLAQTQRQVSTGLRVASAQDNAAYWSIATSLRTRIDTLLAVNDDLGVTSAILGTTAAALSEILASTQDIAKLVIAAQTPGVDRTSVTKQIASLQKHIVATADAASFNGVNLLVTKVVGTESSTETHVFDVDRATAAALHSFSPVPGMETEHVYSGTESDLTKTLGATSSTIRQSTTLDFLGTLTNTATPDGISSSIVISDIVRTATPTSGATADACARLLRGAGAASVCVLTATRR